MNQDIHEKIIQIENKMDKLETNMNRLDSKLDKILEILEKDCKKMTDHIDFIENVYDNVKSPFYYLMDKVNLLSNTTMLEY
jgi:chromosome segregation ATPase